MHSLQSRHTFCAIQKTKINHHLRFRHNSRIREKKNSADSKYTSFEMISFYHSNFWWRARLNSFDMLYEPIEKKRNIPYIFTNVCLVSVSACECWGWKQSLSGTVATCRLSWVWVWTSSSYVNCWKRLFGGIFYCQNI